MRRHVGVSVSGRTPRLGCCGECAPVCAQESVPGAGRAQGGGALGHGSRGLPWASAPLETLRRLWAAGGGTQVAAGMAVGDVADQQWVWVPETRTCAYVLVGTRVQQCAGWPPLAVVGRGLLGPGPRLPGPCSDPSSCTEELPPTVPLPRVGGGGRRKWGFPGRGVCLWWVWGERSLCLSCRVWSESGARMRLGWVSVGPGSGCGVTSPC